MFIKFRNMRINFDNVTNYWFRDKEEEWHVSKTIEIKHRYFVNIEYIGGESRDEIEFETKEQWESAKTMLDSIIKPVDINYKNE